MKLTPFQRFWKYWTYPLRRITAQDRVNAAMLAGWVVTVVCLLVGGGQ